MPGAHHRQMIKKIKNDLLLVYLKIKEIPFLLRFLIICFVIVGPLLVLASIIPIGSYSVNGAEMSFQNFWSSGYALIMMGVGLLITVLAYGLYKRKKWSRHLFIGAYIISYIHSLIFSEEQFDTGVIFATMIMCSLPIWYLYFKKSVRKYFK